MGTDNTPVGTPKTVPKSIFNSHNPVLRNNKFSPDLSIKLNESTTLKTGCSDSVTISSVPGSKSSAVYKTRERNLIYLHCLLQKFHHITSNHQEELCTKCCLVFVVM